MILKNSLTFPSHDINYSASQAVEFRNQKFVAHINVDQKLATYLWNCGLPCKAIVISFIIVFVTKFPQCEKNDLNEWDWAGLD